MKTKSIYGAQPEQSGPATWIWLLVVVLFLAGLAMGVYYFLSGGRNLLTEVPGFLRPPFQGRKHVNILVLGVEDTHDRGRSDTIILATANLETRHLAAISIPRDLWVEIPGHKPNKINAAYNLGGVPLAQETVERLLGIPLHYHIKCSLGGFRHIIDAMGGVEVNVERQMDYDDNYGMLHIHLKPGLQRLNGEQALGYVRFRHERTGDLGRMKRQQEFLRIIAKQLFRPENLPRLPKLIRIVSRNVRTNLTLRELMALKDLARKVDLDHIPTATLPATPRRIRGSDCLEPNQVEIAKVLDQLIYERGATVEVLNGTEVNGLAAEVADRLEGEGFEITQIGNAPEPVETSHIFDNNDHPKEAKQICQLLRCGEVIIGSGDVSLADITIVLGRDYADNIRWGEGL